MNVFTFYEPGVLTGRPREDWFAYDEKNGVFVIADGVSMWPGIEYNSNNYPLTSGAGKVARAFCKAFVAHRGFFKERFKAGNSAAAAVNQKRKGKVLFAATAIAVCLRGPFLEWGQINDCGIAIIGKDGTVKFNRKQSRSYQFPWSPESATWDAFQKTLFFRTAPRNAVDEKGMPIGYGVVTGQKEAGLYFDTGKRTLAASDTVALYSDGFAPYFALLEFRRALARVQLDKLRDKLVSIIHKKTGQLVEIIEGLRLGRFMGDDVIEEIGNIIRKTEVIFHLHKSIPQEAEKWGQEKTLLIIKS